MKKVKSKKHQHEEIAPENENEIVIKMTPKNTPQKPKPKPKSKQKKSKIVGAHDCAQVRGRAQSCAPTKKQTYKNKCGNITCTKTKAETHKKTKT